MYRLINDLRDYEKAESAFAFGQYVHFTGIDDDVETSELDNYLEKRNHKNILVEEIPAGIEDVFMSMQSQSQSQ